MSSEISDIEEDVLLTKDFNRLGQLACRGWKTCSKGFEYWKTNEAHNSKKRKFQRKRKSSTSSGYKSVPFVNSFVPTPPKVKPNTDVKTFSSLYLDPENRTTSAIISQDTGRHGKLQKTKPSVFNDLSNSIHEPLKQTRIVRIDSSFFQSTSTNNSVESDVLNFDESPVISTFNSESCKSSEVVELPETNQIIESCDFSQNSCFLKKSAEANAVPKDIISDIKADVTTLNNGDANTSSCGNKADLKISNWVQRIAWRKDDNNTLSSQVVEKKTFQTGGLAEQAMRLKRRQKTLSVLWSHTKVERSKQLQDKCLQLVLERSAVAYGFTLWKCFVLKKPVNDSTCDTSALEPSGIVISQIQNDEEKYVLLLLKKSKAFSKLASGSKITIYPPWQCLRMPNMSCDTILHAQFVDIEVPTVKNVAIKQCESATQQTCENRGSPQTPSKSNTTERDFPHIGGTASPAEAKLSMALGQADLGSQCDSKPGPNANVSQTPKKISFYGRIQRAWPRCKNSSKISKYELLIQGNNKNRFYILHLVNVNELNSNTWNVVVTASEGKCFRFGDVTVMGVLRHSRYPLLFDFVQDLTQLQEYPVELIICCRVEANCCESTVCQVPSIDFPPFYGTRMSILKELCKRKENIGRFSCVVKVLHQIEQYWYISDFSLKQTAVPCVCVYFDLNAPSFPIQSGDVVFIRESIYKNGMLCVDKFSLVSVASSGGFSTSEIHGNASDVVEKLADLKSSDLTWTSRESDLVSFKGNIKDVDPKSVASWLSCSVENSNQDESFRV